MLRLLRFLTGLALLPLCFAVTWALRDLLRTMPGTSPEVLISSETIALFLGYFLWLAMWFFFPRPVRIYVAAHELTHALWGLLFGARVSKLRVSAQGGSVRLSKSNMLVTLAPYFFPLYTVMIILVRLLLRCFTVHGPPDSVWLFFIGLTWGFHVTFTVQSLIISQPDILEYGRLFSYTIIYLFNLFGVGLWVICTTPATVTTFIPTLIAHTATTYTLVVNGAYQALCWTYDTAKPQFESFWHKKQAGPV